MFDHGSPCRCTKVSWQSTTFPAVQNLHVFTVPLQCPNSALTVPLQFPYVKHTVPLPYLGLEKEVGMILTLSQVG